MKKTFTLTALAAALALSACGSEEARVPTAEEDAKMYEIAAELDNQTVYLPDGEAPAPEPDAEAEAEPAANTQ